MSRRQLMIAVLAAVCVVLGAGIITVSVSGGSSDAAKVSAATPPSAPPTISAPTTNTATRSPGVADTSTPAPVATRSAVTTRVASSQPAKTPAPTTASVAVVHAAAACRARSGTQTLAGRTVIIDLPRRFPAGVIFDYHGGGQSAAQEHAYTGLAQAGAQAGYIVVTPEGTNGLWNFPTTEALPDDVGFTQTIASLMVFAGCSNGKLYTAGISDGADMAITAACKIKEVRAVFAVAPSIIPRGNCTKKPFVEVHGTADPVVPFSGTANGSFADTPSQPVSIRLPWWTAGCSGPSPGRGLEPETTVEDWICPGGRTVELDTVSGGGHTWPGAVGPEPAAGLGVKASWDADAVALAFFASR